MDDTFGGYGGSPAWVFDMAVAREWGIKLAIVAAILVITWALAKGAKWAFARLVNQVPLLQRQSGNEETVGESLGKIVSLLIWLLGLVAALQQLGLDNVIRPLQTLLNQVMGFIPNIFGAGVILFVGLVVARIVRQLIETTLGAVNLDKWAAKSGVDRVTGTNTISRTIATVCFVLIIIPVSIGALDTLQIAAIAEPAKAVLGTVLTAVPLLIGAVLLLGIAFFVGGWVSDMVEDLLSSLGFDRAVEKTGLLTAKAEPSKLVGQLVLVAIMLGAAVQATQMIDFPSLNAILTTILEVGSRVIFGSVIIAVGFLIANLIASIVSRTSDGGELGSTVVRYATIGLFIFIGLAQMGIGGVVVQIAFGAMAVAAAIAFGLGGRDAAARLLDRAVDRVELPLEKASKPAAKGPAKK